MRVVFETIFGTCDTHLKFCYAREYGQNVKHILRRFAGVKTAGFVAPCGMMGSPFFDAFVA